MKKIFQLSLFALLGIGLLSSCAKKNNSTPTVTQSMSANVNGSDWAANSVSGTTGSNQISVVGTRSDGSQLGITMPVGISPGTYNLSYPGGYTVVFTFSNGGFYSTDGQLIISSNSNNAISGTFSGDFSTITGGGQVPFTNGSFTAKY